MGIVLGNYVSKPQPNPNVKPCEAIQLTADNIEQVAEWCNGYIKTVHFADGGEELGIELETNHGALSSPRRVTAYLDQWVAKDEHGFQIYVETTFDYLFQPEVNPNFTFLQKLGEDMFRHAAVRDIVAKAMATAFNTSRKVTDMHDTRIRLEMGTALQVATAEIEKIFRNED